MNQCPKCLRPFNEGNSPNAEECNGTDDDEGLCEAYAKVAELRAETERFQEDAARYQHIRSRNLGELLALYPTCDTSDVGLDYAIDQSIKLYPNG